MHDYLTWNSTITLDDVFSAGESFSYPVSYAGHILYLTQRKQENSRTVLMIKSEHSGEAYCITPNSFVLRTRVSEYGGKPFWLMGDTLFFCNQVDQCIYRQTLAIVGSRVQASEPLRVTPLPNQQVIYMYTDLVMVSETLLLAIVECEDLSDDNVENQSSVVVIDLNDANKSLEVVEQGADFYSNLVVDDRCQQAAWVQWNHPSMPWDENQLVTANITLLQSSVQLIDKTPLLLPESASVCQLMFASNNSLFFSADFLGTEGRMSSYSEDDFWNVYCAKSNAVGGFSEPVMVTNEKLEFGYPHWQYGDSRIVQFDSQTLLTIGSSPGGDQLFLIDQDSLKVTPSLKTNSTIQHLFSGARANALMVELPANQGPRVIQLESDEQQTEPNALFDRTLLNRTLLDSPKQLRPRDVSLAEHVCFVCEGGGSANGFYYPPTNSQYSEKQTLPPPLIVMVHGGPTARAYGHFDIQKQFWTSRGFALLDVNHRGSSGYGRAYRHALYEQWGEIDCADIIDGIKSLVSQGKADAERICIRGKSAGGYAVLRALTEYPDVFKAGACYYGIGNLATLAQSTHKFEKHYTDRLIGEEYDPVLATMPSSQFYQRSPIHKVNKLSSAMIVFQGSLDKVVPPELAHEVISVLKRSNIDHEYVEYSDEAHGFRQVENNCDAWRKELAFYRRVLAH